MSARRRTQHLFVQPEASGETGCPEIGADSIASKPVTPARTMEVKSRRTLLSSASPDRAFYAAALGLLLVCAILHASRLARLTFTNHDDIKMDMIASEIRNEGLAKYWERSRLLAESQGRIYFYFSTALFVAPFFTDNESLRAVSTTLIHFVSYSLLGAFLALYLSNAIALFTVVILCLLLPHWGAHYPVGAYPIVYHMAFVLFFASMILYARALRHSGLVEGRRLILPCIVLFCSYWIYEALWILFLSVSATIAVIESRRRSNSGAMASLRVIALPVAILAANAVVYAGYRAMFPGHYQGSTMSWSTATNVSGISHALSAFSIRSLPGTSFLELMASIRDMNALEYIIYNMAPSELLQMLLAGVCMVLFLDLHWRSDPSALQTRGRIAACIAGFAVLMAFAIPLLPAMTVKYQKDLLYSPYIPGYFAFTMYGVAVAGAVVAAASLIAARAPRVRSTFKVFVAAVVMFASAATAVANTHVVSLLDMEGMKWRMVNGLLQSEVFRHIPDGAIVVAPSLWRGLDPAFTYYNEYWTLYVQQRSGRRVSFYRDFNTISADLYYLDVSGMVGSRNGLLFLSRVAKPFAQSAYLEGENVTAMCSERPKFGSISFLTATGPAADPPSYRRRG